MNIFDSHCHLDDRVFDKEIDAVIQRALAAEVRGMMVVGLGVESGAKAIELADRYEGVYAAIGIHPHDAHTCNPDLLDRLRLISTDTRVKAWGETGLDFNRMHSPREDQESCFITQLRLADELVLPMIFHERDSQGRFLEILKLHWGLHRKGVVHCFSGTDDELDAYLELGLYIGITGIITIKGRGQDLRRQVKRIPLDRLVVETDAPYLTPTPERNKFKRNEPAFVRTVLLKLAAVYGCDPYAMADQTWQNTRTLFDLSSV